MMFDQPPIVTTSTTPRTPDEWLAYFALRDTIERERIAQQAVDIALTQGQALSAIYAEFPDTELIVDAPGNPVTSATPSQST